ncbi:MAG: Stealth CR1 domain-containing protein [Balneolaceae bacterium]|nr:Stealth CR1 domain-containing protein [Balneolaceae bacterium]
MSTRQTEIDAVITWVDGDDPIHKKKKKRVLKELGRKRKRSSTSLPTGRDKTRFLNNGELKYCIDSIRKFAPWIRTIHIITDNQVPEFITESYMAENQIQIVDHREIFRDYEWALPTFNSRTIETALWRIRDLAPQFIYLNDDFVLTSEVFPEDFFKDDKVVLRGEWMPILSYGRFRIKMNEWVSLFAKKVLGITRSMNLLLQIRSAELAGLSKRYYRAHHLPHPIRRETLKDFYEGNGKVFEKNIKYRFRNMNQFSSVYLARHLEIKQKKAILKGLGGYLMLNGETDFSFTIRRKLRQIESGEIRFLCVQAFEHFSEEWQEEIDERLTRVCMKEPEQSKV